MIIDETTARERAWAIPALCALMIFHHDFQIPRLAQIQQLAWSPGALDVSLRYGICNISGNIIDANDFIVTLHRDGAIGMRVNQMLVADSKQAVLSFLTGEVFRETKRWAEDMASWRQPGSALSPTRAGILSIVSAMVAYPAAVSQVAVEKDLGDRSRVRKVRLLDQGAVFEITPAGFRGANLYANAGNADTKTGRFYRKYDIATASPFAGPRHRRMFHRVTHTSSRLVLLPLDLIIHLFEQIQHREQRKSPVIGIERGDRTTRIVDATAGDSLSALFG